MHWPFITLLINQIGASLPSLSINIGARLDFSLPQDLVCGPQGCATVVVCFLLPHKLLTSGTPSICLP